MKRIYLISLILAVVSANAANPLQDDWHRPIRKAISQPNLANQQWSGVFVLKDQKTRIRHTPQMFYMDNVKRKSVNMQNQKYKGMGMNRAGLKLHVGMSRDEFVQALVRSGLYIPPANNWTDVFRLRNGTTITHTPYWVELDGRPKTRNLSVNSEGLNKLTLAPQGLKLNVGMSRAQFVQALIRSRAYAPPRRKQRQAEFFPLKKGGYVIRSSSGMRFELRGESIGNCSLSAGMSRAAFVNELKKAGLYAPEGRRPRISVRNSLNMPKEKGRWEGVFVLNDGQRIRHKSDRLVYDGQAYNSLTLPRGLEVTVDMTRAQFVNTLRRARIYP